MKVKRLIIQNILSYKERTEFVFDNTINIIIGPNGGGKTNLQKILALTLSKYFIHQYDFQYNDQEASIRRLDPWTKRVLERNLPRFNGDESEQVIEIELIPESSDIENIKTIGNNLNKFNEQLEYWQSPFDSYSPTMHVDKIEASKFLTYIIKDLELQESPMHSAEWAFAEYLRTFFIFMRLSGKDSSTKLSSPVFFFFSERNAGRSLDIGAGNLTEQNYYQGFQSVYQSALGDNTNLMQWGAQHFARLHRRCTNRAAQKREATTQDFLVLEEDVQLLDRYMHQLGYDFTFLTDDENAAYRFALKKGDDWITADRFSSGEREIVHFLLAMFALNAKDGLVLVDEPELHLHPRWQQIFLHLFQDLSKERKNQFIISTHSPVFVTPETINSIIIVYRKDGIGTLKISLREVDLPEKKNLVRMINSQNNERIFFADKVVLVEGIADRLVFSSLLERATAKFSNHLAIEVVEVGGKNNFADYKVLLDALETEAFIVSDRDYLFEVGDPKTKALFESSSEKASSALVTDHKSTDRRTLVSELRKATSIGNTDRLKELLTYIENRHVKFKCHLTPEEQIALTEDLDRLRKNRCFVLKYGEIEDYLPPGVSDLRGIVEMTTDPNWINNIPDASKRSELARIVSDVLNLQFANSSEFQKQASEGRVDFPRAPVGVLNSVEITPEKT